MNCEHERTRRIPAMPANVPSRVAATANGVRESKGKVLVECNA